MSDRIELRGLQLLARVGVLDEERDRPQPVEVDLDLALALKSAGGSDHLADTVDYGAVCDRVALVVTAGHVALLEHLAEVIAQAVLSLDDRLDEVTVAVRKLRPPVAHTLATSGVRITRSR